MGVFLFNCQLLAGLPAIEPRSLVVFFFQNPGYGFFQSTSRAAREKAVTCPVRVCRSEEYALMQLTVKIAIAIKLRLLFKIAVAIKLGSCSRTRRALETPERLAKRAKLSRIVKYRKNYL